MTRGEEIEALEAKLKARENRPGFEANAEALRARIERLKQEAADGV